MRSEESLLSSAGISKVSLAEVTTLLLVGILFATLMATGICFRHRGGREWQPSSASLT